MSNLILLSLKPEHAANIYSGRKTVELRKNCPAKSVPLLALFYESGPVKAVTGSISIDNVITASPDFIWEHYGSRTCISQDDFRRYFGKKYAGHAWEVASMRRYDEPIPLAELRQRWPGFHPPQSWRYLDSGQWDTLTKIDHVK